MPDTGRCRQRIFVHPNLRLWLQPERWQLDLAVHAGAQRSIDIVHQQVQAAELDRASPDVLERDVVALSEVQLP